MHVSWRAKRRLRRARTKSPGFLNSSESIQNNSPGFLKVSSQSSTACINQPAVRASRLVSAVQETKKNFRKVKRNISFRYAILAAIGASTFGLCAYAASSGNVITNVIKACYNSSSGVMFLNLTGGACMSGFSPLSWNQQGPQGPAGPPGPAGAGSLTVLDSHNNTVGSLLSQDWLLFKLNGFSAQFAIRVDGFENNDSSGVQFYHITVNCSGTRYMSAGDLPASGFVNSGNAYVPGSALSVSILSYETFGAGLNVSSPGTCTTLGAAAPGFIAGEVNSTSIAGFVPPFTAVSGP